MNERVKQLRESLGLSRAAFGEKFGVSGDVINNIERGRVEAKELLIAHMCSVYNVNIDWLMNGTGEMFTELSEDEELAKWIGEIQFKSIQKERVAMIKKRLLVALSHIKSDEAWIAWEQAIEEIAESKKHSEE